MISLKKIGVTTLSAGLLMYPFASVNAENITSINAADTLKSCLTANSSNVCSLGGDVTLTSSINVKGEKTLNLNGYSITLNKSNAVLNVVGGQLTVDDSGNGSIKNNTGYGIYALNGGKVVFNNGSVESNYSALSGNNTTGDMNFEVNGGTLTTANGAAIYMPGQVNLKINGGVINGGVNIRMGQIDITGGTINNLNSNNVSKIEQYYNYSGNVFYGDAIAINAGSYTSDNATYENSLNLKITGGTINSTMGHALALYSLGKVSQESNITISGGTLNGKDGAVLVRDMTKEDFVSGAYKAVSNTPVIKVNGGTFNTSVEAYLDTNYIEKQNSNNYTVEKNIKLTADDTNGNPIATFESAVAMPNDYELVVTERTLSDDVKKSIVDSKLYKSVKNLELLKVYDISVMQNGSVVRVDNNTYKISLKVDKDLVKNYKNFKVLYIDDNNEVKEVLDAVYANGYITFKTTHLSTYAIAGYNDTASEVANPKTSDNIIIFTILGVVALLGITGSWYFKRKLN